MALVCACAAPTPRKQAASNPTDEPRVEAMPPHGDPAPRSEQPPAPPPYACMDHDECVLFCPEVGGCCGNPCGCNQAVNRAYVTQLTRDYARDCARPPDCPAVACQFHDAGGAMCIDGRCRAGGLGY